MQHKTKHNTHNTPKTQHETMYIYNNSQTQPKHIYQAINNVFKHTTTTTHNNNNLNTHQQRHAQTNTTKNIT